MFKRSCIRNKGRCSDTMQSDLGSIPSVYHAGPGKEQQVVETVFEKLYTPYGLRTLEQEDQEFHGLYQGKMEDRDMAYHQGTVWTFLWELIILHI